MKDLHFTDLVGVLWPPGYLKEEHQKLPKLNIPIMQPARTAPIFQGHVLSWEAKIRIMWYYKGFKVSPAIFPFKTLSFCKTYFGNRDSARHYWSRMLALDFNPDQSGLRKQPSFFAQATQTGSEEGRLFSQAMIKAHLSFSDIHFKPWQHRLLTGASQIKLWCLHMSAEVRN